MGDHVLEKEWFFSHSLCLRDQRQLTQSLRV